MQKKLVMKYEQKLKERDSQTQQMKSESLSIISELKKELQLKSETIVKLNERIEKLATSDQELREARALRQEAESVMKTVETKLSLKMEKVENVKTEYENKINELEIIKKPYEMRLAEVKTERAHIRDEIKQEAERMTRLARGDLIIKNNIKYVAHEGFYIAVLLYGILITVLKGVRTEIIRKDIVAASLWIWKLAASWWQIVMKKAQIISTVSINISNDVIRDVLHWILFGMVVVAMIAVSIGGIGYGCYRIGKIYYYELWDRISLAVVLVSVAVIVNFAEETRGMIPVNVVLVFVVVQLVYMIVRKGGEVVRNVKKLGV